MFFEIGVLRAAAALVGTGLAAWEDARTSFIDDRTTLSMIGLGIVLDVFFLPQELWLSTALIALVIGIIGYFAYRAGQFGGGDVLLILGIHLLLPQQTQALFASAVQAFAPAYPPVVSILATASLTAVIVSGVWYAFRLHQEKGFGKNKTLAFAVVSAVAVAAIAFSPLSLALKVFFALLLLPAFFYVLFKREVMDCVVVKKLRLRDVEDEDVLYLEGLPQSLVKRFNIQRVLTRGEVKKLRFVEKKTGRRVWPVCKELPRFAPFLLLGLLFVLFFGDFLVIVLFS
ncbi:prepilin peptidase [Candidatus Micrarchaeota archaeon]|nr:prepilin peptidase [Candidatus Micrarchaeota archaeon]